MSSRFRSARPLSASLLAVKGSARPAQGSAIDAAIYGDGNNVDTAADMPAAPSAPVAAPETTASQPVTQNEATPAPKRTAPAPARAANQHFGGQRVSERFLATKTLPTQSHATAQPNAKVQSTPAADVQAKPDAAPQRVKTARRMPAQTKSASPLDNGKKAAFTFRIAERQHLRLRLLSAHENRSSQKIMEDALETYLAKHAPHPSGESCACYDRTGEA